jgi:hypothetical protein
MKSGKWFVFLSLFMFFAVFSGCLETPVAAPPAVDEKVLEGYGWVQVGDVLRESMEFNISDQVIKINTATVRYADRSLEEDIVRQIGAYASVDVGFTAQMTAMRIVLPAGVPLPSRLVLEMASRQVEGLVADMGIEDFHEVKTVQIAVKNGKMADAKVYAGHISFGNNNSVPFKGILTAWRSSGSTLMVAAIYPSDDFVLKADGQKVIISVDGAAEYEEILRLLQNME